MCVCGKSINLKLIYCDTCDREFHIPCVQEEIVRQKDRITKVNPTITTPNYQNAYQCPISDCEGELTPKEVIPYRTWTEYNNSLHGTLIYIDWKKYKIQNYVLTLSAIILFFYMLLSVVLYTKSSSEIRHGIDDINLILTNLTAEEYETVKSNRLFTVIFSCMAIAIYSCLLGTYFMLYNRNMMETMMTIIPSYVYVLLSIVLFALCFKKIGDIKDDIDDIDFNSLDFNRNQTINTLHGYASTLENRGYYLWLMMSIWLYVFGIVVVCLFLMVILTGILIGCSIIYTKLKTCFCHKEKDCNKDVVMNNTHFVSVDL